ncbi:MAG: molecular chaperone DnaK [Candidatus Argoarchaeum ethanivorans]|uniref:Molecular chaperone DnaK n=1 Tax=Candidatus Argoarchaeum ethanivorans TaxID=2608793 RepID=A0A8B3S1K9_9EURY|nr:MAG: molecular chaperone DnaK [Candidatus Argoarchaeum ethanivorans]
MINFPMIDTLKSYFSSEKKIDRFEKKLQKAVSANDQEKIVSIFSKEFRILLNEKNVQRLSNLILRYGSLIENITLLSKEIQSDCFKQAIGLLEENKLDAAALELCDYFGFNVEAIEILAKRGRANELTVHVTKDKVVDRELLQSAIICWEKYNGDIRTDQTMCGILKNIAEFSIESIPDNPRVREAVGEFKAAAFLYVIEGNLSDAAKCYENAGVYPEACKFYEYAGDNEGVSRAAESLGDLEKALEFVVKPERKVKLLMGLERFFEAREFAAGLEHPDEYFGLIKEMAKKRMDVKIKSSDFVGAMKLADVAECGQSTRKEILLLGREHFSREIASLASGEDAESIYRDWIKLEENAGKFEEAGRIAEDDLNDSELAIEYYEKANLINRAIGLVDPDNLIKLAELHEKGGNLLKAANFYRLVERYDEAYTLYENIQHFKEAIECYLKTSDPSRDVLIRLCAGAGEFERVVEIYMESGTFQDLEKALSIAKTYDLTSHIRVIQDKITEHLLGSETDLKRLFTRAMDEVLGSYSQVFGIDFGTTNSVAAIFNKKSKEAEIILTFNGSEFEPSFFGIDDDNHPIFGEAARLRSLIAPNTVIGRVKRSIGTGKKFLIGGKRYRSEEVVAKILQRFRLNADTYLKSKVESRFYELLDSNNLKFTEETLNKFLNEQKGYSHIKDVVLSVPAYFNDSQKRATRDSAEIAGLRVRRLLHEPTAAALAYGYQRAYSGRLEVVDLGGGTLDISILDVDKGVYDIQAIGGDTKLGGSDIDLEIVRYVAENIKATIGVDINEKSHPIEFARLIDACENLKINLSSVNEYTMELVHFLNRPAYTFTINRTELEKLSQHILDRIKAKIEEIKTDSVLNVDHFLLVGNATKMPAVGKLVEKTIRARNLGGIDPGTVVARGSALEGAILAGDITQSLLLDIVPYSLGVAAVKRASEHNEKEISRLIERNSKIPINKSNIYSTAKDNQPNVHVEVYQGESKDPHKNYFLGDFILDEISPAPAGMPQIEVTFDIDADCILTVTAVDKGTGNKQSIRIEGAITLSPNEKRNLRRYFTESEQVHSLEKDLKNLTIEIERLKSSCDKSIDVAERSTNDFFELFHERVEVNASFYTANSDQVSAIQDMFTKKNQLNYDILKYKDQFTTILNNVKRVQIRHLDFSDNSILSKLQERIDLLSNYRVALKSLIASVEENVTTTVIGWLEILKSMEPNTDKMTPLEEANYYLTMGRVDKARKILESVADKEGLTEKAFHLLLKCYIRLGLREEYRNTHKRFGSLFGLKYPDFNRLNAFLNAVDDSIFMIQKISQKKGYYSGSGFCIAPNLIVTNRHVVEGSKTSDIKIIGKNKIYTVDELKLDPINDLAILKLSGDLKPLRDGEFDFVEPGEQILAIGFPSPNSEIFSENIYISKGIVNSIRKIDVSSERVIFIDAKIGKGMSGSPLINEIGEVVGIVTLVRYQPIGQNGRGIIAVEDQPVALPIHLIKKYLIS